MRDTCMQGYDSLLLPRTATILDIGEDRDVYDVVIVHVQLLADEICADDLRPLCTLRRTGPHTS